MMKSATRSKKNTARATVRAGISVRLLGVVLFFAAALTIVISLLICNRTVSHAQALYRLEEERKQCDDAIQRLLDGSDYLTVQVQQYVVRCDRRFMDAYWTEINETQSREKAIDDILGMRITLREREAALAVKTESDDLRQNEIRAMRLTSESLGMPISKMPTDVAAYRLNAADEALSAKEKQETAIFCVFSPAYTTAKASIRTQGAAFRNEITNRYSEETLAALSGTQRTSVWMTVEIVLFAVLFGAAVLYFGARVIFPIIGFSRELNRYKNLQNIRLREHGAAEILQFSRAFNALSDQVEKDTDRLARLGYYDYLTNVRNRASITEYVEAHLTAADAPLGLMILDIDNFKHFNDTYGHACGDRVLQQVAQAICAALPEDAGVAGRLCGEEFIIALPHTDEAALRTVAETALGNVRALRGTDVDMAAEQQFRITVSAGGMLWEGEYPTDFTHLLSLADKAL